MNFLTVQEASKRTGITEAVLYYEMSKGRLAFQEMVGRRVIMEDELDRFVQKARQKEILTTPTEYCKKNKISRSTFNYRKLAGKIDTVKIDGRVFVREVN